MATQTTTPKRESYITPPVILSYPALFEPRTPPGATDPKYSCALVFPPDTPRTVLAEVWRRIDEAGRDKFGAKYDAMKAAGKIKLPIRTDAEDRGYPSGSWYFNATSQSQPGIVGPQAGVDGKPLAITNPEELYPGCIVRASIGFFGFDKAGSKGVAAGLRNIQKLREGTRLDNRRKAEDEFDAVEAAAFEDSLL